MPYHERRGNLAEKDHLSYDAFIGKLAIVASCLVRQSYALTIFGTDIGVDPRAIEDLKTALLNRHGIMSSQYIVANSTQSTHDLLATMSAVDYVVTCRFHGVVFAHMLNKPVLAISPHPKVMNLMTDLELSSYCVDIRDCDPKLLVEKFASMVIHAREIKSRMAASLAENRQRLRSQFDELFRYEPTGRGWAPVEARGVAEGQACSHRARSGGKIRHAGSRWRLTGEAGPIKSLSTYPWIPKVKI
jgi:hypothetical protein